MPFCERLPKRIVSLRTETRGFINGNTAKALAWAIALFRNRAVMRAGAKRSFARITRCIPNDKCEERLSLTVVDNPACAYTGEFRQINLTVHSLIHFSGTSITTTV